MGGAIAPLSSYVYCATALSHSMFTHPSSSSAPFPVITDQKSTRWLPPCLPSAGALFLRLCGAESDGYELRKGNVLSALTANHFPMMRPTAAWRRWAGVRAQTLPRKFGRTGVHAHKRRLSLFPLACTLTHMQKRNHTRRYSPTRERASPCTYDAHTECYIITEPYTFDTER